MEPAIEIVAYTTLDKWVAENATGNQWAPTWTDGDAGSLSEFAGRACYASWSRPNPATANNRGYLANIIDQGHLSVLEHGTVTFYIYGASRSFTHELVRHRHLSFSQLSQRFVKVEEGGSFVTPPLFADDRVAQSILGSQWIAAVDAYHALVKLAEAKGVSRKEAREAARAVLPNMTPTNIVVTGNHRTWREFILKRATVAADAEMRIIARRIFELLAGHEPNLYADLHIVAMPEHGCTVVEPKNGRSSFTVGVEWVRQPAPDGIPTADQIDLPESGGESRPSRTVGEFDGQTR